MDILQKYKGGGETPPSIEDITDAEYELAHKQGNDFNLTPNFICLNNEDEYWKEHRKKQVGNATQQSKDEETTETSTTETAILEPSNHFEQRASGLYHIEIDSKGEEKEAWICSPIKVLGQTRDKESNA